MPDLDALRRAARRFGTPVAITDLGALDAAIAELTAAFPDPWLRQFSVKANDVAPIVRLIAERGFGANVVSRGEWRVASRAGVPNAAITLEGIGKTDADLRAAVAASRGGVPLRWLAIESLDEAAALVRIAARAGLTEGGLDVLFRLNPAVTPETHAGLAVGAAASKFGMTETELTEAVGVIGRAPGLVARGVHIHVGSQLGAVDAFRDAVRRALALLALLRGGDDRFDTLDLGGGFPVAPLGQVAPPPERFAREVEPLIEALPPDRRPARLAIEPGRRVVARAGVLVARVLHVRERAERRQVILDAGMTELIRPALYGAFHPVEALTSLGRPVRSDAATGLSPADVDGPICESTDHLGSHELPALRRGDLVVIRDSGAYGASLGSTYNGRPRPPQVLLEPGGQLSLLRRRGSIAALG
ncbi:MAG TPA: diaminopimelate decarboxylase [Candidatus Polarisedimenticolia bacterium]|nr:diaminopimelate decarboxylase [Candidatus Polarisedimenticolia bacterium]